MDMIQWMMELPAAQVIVALLVLPWIGVALTHAFSVGARARLDDAWRLRAEAAVRWTGADANAGASVEPKAQPRHAVAISVLRSRIQREQQAALRYREPAELDAA